MKQAILTLKASGLIICYPNSETMETTINKHFCLSLYVNPLRDTWYSRKYAEPQKHGGQQPRLHLRDINGLSFSDTPEMTSDRRTGFVATPYIVC